MLYACLEAIGLYKLFVNQYLLGIWKAIIERRWWKIKKKLAKYSQA